MQKTIIKSNIILFILISLFLGVILAFVDFSSFKKEEKQYNVTVYKSYYVYDNLSNPISLSYDMINLDKRVKEEKVIEKVFKKAALNISNTLQLNGIKIEDKIVTLNVNEDISNYDKLNVECLINSIIDINHYQQIKIVYENDIKIFEKTLDNYYINSPIINKLYTYLYRDNNYKIIYLDQQNNNHYLKILTNKEKTVIYKIDEIQQKWTIKNDGLYIDDEKILPKSYKVGDKYDNCTITSVNLDQDNTQIITVEKNMPDFTIVYTLKQGLGVIKYTKLNNANQIIEQYTYQEKIFNEGE